jgi:hypothetical protein
VSNQKANQPTRTDREPDDFPQPNPTNPTKNGEILSQPARKATAGRMRAFIDAYTQTGHVTRACETVGISRDTHYHKLGTDEAYRAAFEEAQEQVGDLLEDAVFDRALNGVRKQLFYQGEPVMLNGEYVYETVYDSHREHILLKRFKREAYKERIEQQISGEITIADRIGTARKRVLELNRSAQDTDPEDLAG